MINDKDYLKSTKIWTNLYMKIIFTIWEQHWILVLGLVPTSKNSIELLTIRQLGTMYVLVFTVMTVSCYWTVQYYSLLEVPVLQYSQRHTVINHSDRCYHPPGWNSYIFFAILCYVSSLFLLYLKWCNHHS